MNSLADLKWGTGAPKPKQHHQRVSPEDKTRIRLAYKGAAVGNRATIAKMLADEIGCSISWVKIIGCGLDAKKYPRGVKSEPVTPVQPAEAAGSKGNAGARNERTLAPGRPEDGPLPGEPPEDSGAHASVSGEDQGKAERESAGEVSRQEIRDAYQQVDHDDDRGCW